MASLANSKGTLFIMAGVALAVGFGFVVDRAMFLSSAARTEAEVLEIQSVASECGKGNRECTRFVIRLGWSGGGEEFEAGIEVAHARGYGAPVPSDLGYAVGDAVPLVYNPDDPSEHYLANGSDLWRTPLIVLGIAAFLGLVGLFGHKKVA